MSCNSVEIRDSSQKTPRLRFRLCFRLDFLQLYEMEHKSVGNVAFSESYLDKVRTEKHDYNSYNDLSSKTPWKQAKIWRRAKRGSDFIYNCGSDYRKHVFYYKSQQNSVSSQYPTHVSKFQILHLTPRIVL